MRSGGLTFNDVCGETPVDDIYVAQDLNHATAGSSKVGVILYAKRSRNGGSSVADYQQRCFGGDV